MYPPLQEEFTEHLIGCINHLLLVFKRDPAIERCVDFVVKFSSELYKSDTQARSSMNAAQNRPNILK